MATLAFPEISKVVTLPSGVTYNYVCIAASSTKPTILFMHGFPSSCYDWRHQITHFSQLGYGVLAPDLLGYGGTDKPTALMDYRGKKMASEMKELLVYENIIKVHGVSHDWGNFLHSRLANFYPEVLLSSTFMASTYRTPGGKLDVDAVNNASKKALGYELMGYWRFFEKQEANQIMLDHSESFTSILYPKDPSTWRTYMAPLGALEAFAKSNKTVEIGDYVSPAELKIHLEIFSDDYNPALNWYRAAIQNINLPDEVDISPSLPSTLPVLQIVATRDALGNPLAVAEMKTLVPNLRIVELETGHWVQLEAVAEVNQALETFLQDVDEGRIIP